MSLLSSLFSSCMNYFSCNSINLTMHNPINQSIQTIRVIQCPSFWASIQTPLILLCLYCTILIILLRCLTICNGLIYAANRYNRLFQEQQRTRQRQAAGQDNIANHNANNTAAAPATTTAHYPSLWSRIGYNAKFAAELSWHLLIAFICAGPDDDMDSIIDLSTWATNSTRNRINQFNHQHRRSSADLTQSPHITVTRRVSISASSSRASIFDSNEAHAGLAKTEDISCSSKSSPIFKKLAPSSPSTPMHIQRAEDSNDMMNNITMNSAVESSSPFELTSPTYTLSQEDSSSVLIPTDPDKSNQSIELRSNLCAICWEEFELDGIVLVTDCSHVYHPPCLQRWADHCDIDKNITPSCPLCRNSIA
jgi:hypothetical protein